jgi:chaperonin GroEL
MSENKIVKDISQGQPAKDLILSGVNKVCDVVGSTLGYRGKTVLIETDGYMPEITKDGYKVLHSIYLENPVEALASEVIKEASKKTVDFAGDATTTTAILAQAFLQNSFKELEKGKSPIDIKQDIDKSVELVVEYLKEISIPITDKLIYDIAKTSANGDEEIAKLVQDAFLQTGENGAVSHERSNTDETFIDKIEGTLVESGFIDEGFINAPSSQSVIFDNDPMVLCSLIKIQTKNEILPFLEYAVSVNRDLVIISEMEFNLANMVLANKIKGNSNFVIVNPPSGGKKRKDLMKDLALVCGTNAIDSLSGNDFTNRETMFLGTAKKVSITCSNTIVTHSGMVDNLPIEGKIKELKESITDSTNEGEKKYIMERISKLHGGISVIKVGGITPSEVDEKIDRVDDAICAVRSAKEEGVVAGGGIALKNASDYLSLDEITKKSLYAPYNKILSNANIKEILQTRNYPIGYDVKNFKEVNMIDTGIVDCTKGVRNALINAVSASNNLLMTDNVITLKRITHE